MFSVVLVLVQDTSSWCIGILSDFRDEFDESAVFLHNAIHTSGSTFCASRVPGSPAAPTASYGKSGGRREPSYCETDSSISSDMGGGGGGRGSSRSSFGSSLSGSPGGSEGSFRGKDPMQYSDDEDEGKEGYKVGGYHTVNVSRCTANCGAPLFVSRCCWSHCTKTAVRECFKTNDQYGMVWYDVVWHTTRKY